MPVEDVCTIEAVLVSDDHWLNSGLPLAGVRMIWMDMASGGGGQARIEAVDSDGVVRHTYRASVRASDGRLTWRVPVHNALSVSGAAVVARQAGLAEDRTPYRFRLVNPGPEPLSVRGGRIRATVPLDQSLTNHVVRYIRSSLA